MKAICRGLRSGQIRALPVRESTGFDLKIIFSFNPIFENRLFEGGTIGRGRQNSRRGVYFLALTPNVRGIDHVD